MVSGFFANSIVILCFWRGPITRHFSQNRVFKKNNYFSNFSVLSLILEISLYLCLLKHYFVGPKNCRFVTVTCFSKIGLLNPNFYCVLGVRAFLGQVVKK